MNSDEAPLSIINVVDSLLMNPRSLNKPAGSERTPLSSSGSGVGEDGSSCVTVGAYRSLLRRASIFVFVVVVVVVVVGAE